MLIGTRRDLVYVGSWFNKKSCIKYVLVEDQLWFFMLRYKICCLEMGIFFGYLTYFLIFLIEGKKLWKEIEEGEVRRKVRNLKEIIINRKEKQKIK